MLAEGSLRSVISRLAKGERLVASPSYCVNAFTVEPALRERVCQGTGVLSIPARELAAIALAHRHTTIRGKTINQLEFTLRYMDQFYWLVDDRTLLGHQIPIAIVGMRPERHVVEPNSYWDHGLMLEYCPTAPLCVIGDSDEFLMIELRDKDVAQELIEPGRPDPKVTAQRMITFLTEYQRSCAGHELTLHSGEIPADAATAREQLRAYLNEVLSQLPSFLPSHVDHPQWNYHRPGFVEFRHKCLSERLGSLTEVLPPPTLFSKLDRAWWKFDGMEKGALHRLTELRDFVDRQLRLLGEAAHELERAGARPSTTARAEFESKLQAARSHIALQRSAITVDLDKYLNREGLALKGVGLAQLEGSSPEPESHGCVEMQSAPFHDWRRDIDDMARNLSELQQLGMQLVDLELEAPRNEYHLMLPRRITSAAIPYVQKEIPSTDAKTTTLVRKLYHALLRFLVSRALKPLSEIIAAAATNSGSHILCVGSASGLPESALKGVHGVRTRLSTAGMMTGNFAKAFKMPPKFDLCVCDLNLAELLEFPLVVAAIRPFMADRGIIIGFHMKENMAASPSDLVLTIGLFTDDFVRIQRTGSWRILLLRGFRSFRILCGRFKSAWMRKQTSKLLFDLLVRMGMIALSVPIALVAVVIAFLRRPVVIFDATGSIVIEILVAHNKDLK